MTSCCWTRIPGGTSVLEFSANAKPRLLGVNAIGPTTLRGQSSSSIVISDQVAVIYADWYLYKETVRNFPAPTGRTGGDQVYSSLGQVFAHLKTLRAACLVSMKNQQQSICLEIDESESQLFVNYM